MGTCILVDNPNIDVIMSIYNGVEYIHQQIESIYFQTLRPSRLLVRDDGSNDGSIELILNLKEIYGSWLCLLSFVFCSLLLFTLLIVIITLCQLI